MAVTVAINHLMIELAACSIVGDIGNSCLVLYFWSATHVWGGCRHQRTTKLTGLPSKHSCLYPQANATLSFSKRTFTLKQMAVNVWTHGCQDAEIKDG